MLYKYANPNLVAIAIASSASGDTSAESAITIALVDAVTGALVHLARVARSRPPVHLVHCENWLAYAYWNERARRTELGIIELYEGTAAGGGEAPSNATAFSSHASLRAPLSVHAQSYIFAQGVSAMAATETGVVSERRRPRSFSANIGHS